MAKPPQIATIEGDTYSAYVVWGSEASVYRPRASETSHDMVYVFSKHRTVTPFTVRQTGEEKNVLQCKDLNGNKYLLVYDKGLRELWAWHGINTNSTQKPSTPYAGPGATVSVSQVTGPWRRSNTLVAVLRGRLL